jgi:Flp pilus assembly pilin Flp
MVEYALLMGLIAVTAGSILSDVSTGICRMFSVVSSQIAPGINQTGVGG